jgi:hypothetical protein
MAAAVPVMPGAMSMTAAETSATPDVVDLLLEQHDEIKSLFTELQPVEGPGKQEL